MSSLRQLAVVPAMTTTPSTMTTALAVEHARLAGQELVPVRQHRVPSPLSLEETVRPVQPRTGT